MKRTNVNDPFMVPQKQKKEKKNFFRCEKANYIHSSALVINQKLRKTSEKYFMRSKIYGTKLVLITL